MRLEGRKKFFGRPGPSPLSQAQLYDLKFHNMTKQNDDDDDDDEDDKDHAMITTAQATFRPIQDYTQPDGRIQNIYLTYLWN